MDRERLKEQIWSALAQELKWAREHAFLEEGAPPTRISQIAMGRALGFDQAHVSRIESWARRLPGRAPPKTTELSRIVEWFERCGYAFIWEVKPKSELASPPPWHALKEKLAALSADDVRLVIEFVTYLPSLHAHAKFGIEQMLEAARRESEPGSAELK